MLIIAIAIPVGGNIEKIEKIGKCQASSKSEITAPLSQVDDWPMFHHDLNHSGYSTSTAPDKNKILWKYTAGDKIESSPVVADGKVYVISYDSYLYCMDAYTGDFIWNYYVGDFVSSTPAVANGKVYSGGRLGLYCLDADTGDRIWNYLTSGRISWSSPAVANGKVYFGSEDYNLYCLDADDGAVIWTYTTEDWIRSSPAVCDGKIYFGSADYYLYCLDADNGEFIWSYNSDGLISSSPSIADGKVYFGSSDYKLYCLDADTGNFIWNFLTSSPVFSSPAIAEGKVYVGSHDYKLYCLDADDGAEIWNYNTGNWVVSSPAVCDGKVYVGSNTDNVYCLDADNGSWIWVFSTANIVISSPAVCKGNVYVGSNDNNLYCFGEPNRPPETPIEPNGPDYGVIETEYSFTTSTIDPEEEEIYYKFDWGNGIISEWFGPFASGDIGEGFYTWTTAGTFEVRVKAKDVKDSESNWSEPHNITIVNIPLPRIVSVNGGFLKIKALIKNIGDLDANNVNWSISLKGGAFIGRKTEGSVLNIQAGESITISSNLIVGIGQTLVTFDVWIPESSDTREQSGFVFLFYVKVNPGG
jgi:outer membrane protein assembly factor BamB